jgi:hypothetical protein
MRELRMVLAMIVGAVAAVLAASYAALLFWASPTVNQITSPVTTCPDNTQAFQPVYAWKFARADIHCFPWSAEVVPTPQPAMTDGSLGGAP